MNLTEQIQSLEKQISNLKIQVSNCKHVFTEPKYDPSVAQEPFGFVYEGHGSDFYGSPAGYNEVKKDRWSRTCNICGTVEYTTKQETVKVIQKPKF